MKARFRVPSWASHVISDLTDLERNPHPVDASKVRRFTLELPDDVYFEYGFIDQTGTVRADPDNPERADNPWYSDLSAVTGPDYHPGRYASPAPATGTFTRHRLHSAGLDQLRRVVVYTPAGHQHRPLPLVLVQDGTAYLRVGRLDGGARGAPRCRPGPPRPPGLPRAGRSRGRVPVQTPTTVPS